MKPAAPRCRYCGSTRAVYRPYCAHELQRECVEERACERRRIVKAIRELRAKWAARVLGGKVHGKLFEGAARAVQALDEVLAAVRKRRP